MDDRDMRQCGAEAVVIGAGAAGLAAATELRSRDVDVVVLEHTNEIGASWAHRYEGLRLNTVRWLSAPRRSRIPRSAGRWPGRQAFAEHLRDLARRLGTAVELGIGVSRVDRVEDGYVLETSSGQRRARFVVVATGYDHTPFVPAWPGLASFQGRLVHAAEYRSARDFRDEDVLVVGSGNTGTEIAVQLHRAGSARVRIAVRTPPNIVPLEPLGIPITLVARLSELQPAGVVDLTGALLQRLYWGDLTSHGLPSAPFGIGTELLVKGLGPVVDRGFVKAVKAGEIEVVPAVASLDGGRVSLADGRHIEPQVVIAATGYRHGLEPLVGHLGVLSPTGRPACVRGEANSAAPGLYFSGFWLPASGQLPAMRRTTRRIGREISRLKRRGIPEAV